MSDVQHCSTCRCTDDWPELTKPEYPVGQQIRCRKVTEIGLVRLGNSEPKAIIAETKDYVIFETWSAGGKSLGERCLPRGEFEDNYERRTR